jgi:hypothetical protein
MLILKQTERRKKDVGVSSMLVLHSSQHGMCDQHENILYRGELLLSENELLTLNSFLESSEFSFTYSRVSKSLDVGKRRSVNTPPVSAIPQVHVYVPKRRRTDSINAKSLRGWRMLCYQMIDSILMEPDVGHWLSQTKLPENVAGFESNHLPSSLSEIRDALHDFASLHSHLDFSSLVTNFISSVLAVAPLNHPLYAVSWKLRRLFTEKMRRVSHLIENRELYTKELPVVQALVDELDEGTDSETQETTSASLGSQVFRQGSATKQDQNTVALLARLSALESKVTKLTGKKPVLSQSLTSSIPLSSDEIAQVEEMIGSLSDTQLEKLIEEKLQNTKAIRYEKDPDTGDDTAVIDIGVLPAKEQRLVRKWVVGKLGQSQKKVREQGKMDKAKELEDHVEKMLEKRKRNEDTEKEEAVRLKSLQRRDDEMRKYLGMIDEDLESGSDLD